MLVKNNHADIGIAFDGDGDRSIICDGDGKILTGDSSSILLCSYLLEKNLNSIVVTCLNSSTTIEKIALQTNSQVIRTKVGSVEVSRRMVTDDALIGYEKKSGVCIKKLLNSDDIFFKLFFFNLLASIIRKFFLFFNIFNASMFILLQIITSKNIFFNSRANFLLILKLQETMPPNALTGSDARANL